MTVAARRLGHDPMFCKGLAVGRGVRLTEVGNAIVMDEADVARLAKFLEGKSIPVNPRRRALERAASS